MVKIQEIKRKDGSKVYTISIPKQIVEIVNYKKGDEMYFKINEDKTVTIIKIR
jgi:antitoxin component of MazEF toxin-antitoxin module